jgi:hypothetical protein
MRRRFGHRFERKSLNAEPRSAYLLRGLSRTEWQHSIPGLEALRYSITFRNVLNGAHHRGPDLDVAKNGLQPMLAIAIMLDSWIQSGPAGTAVPRVGKLGANSTLRMSVR